MAKFFSTNEGSFDRAARIIVGLAVLAMVFVGPKSLWGLVGIVPLLTGIVGICPIYSVLGINTCGMRSPKRATQN